MLLVLGKLFLSGIGAIGKELRLAQKQKLDAKNESERIAADQNIETLKARRDVLMSEAKSAWNVVFRTTLAAPFALFVWKVVVYDKILGLGVTDDLSPDMWNLMMVVYGFYFVYETAVLFKKS